MSTRRNFLKKIAGVAASLPIAVDLRAEKKQEPKEEQVKLPEGEKAADGCVFVVGESWCRFTESIDEEIKISELDKWFNLRLKQLDLGIKIYTCCVRPENDFPEGTEEQQDTYQKIDDEMDDMFGGWEIESPLKEATREDIKRWFEKRELSLCAEESAIGVSQDRARSWMFYGWQANWEANHREDRIEYEMKLAGW